MVTPETKPTPTPETKPTPTDIFCQQKNRKIDRILFPFRFSTHCQPTTPTGLRGGVLPVQRDRRQGAATSLHGGRDYVGDRRGFRSSGRPAAGARAVDRAFSDAARPDLRFKVSRLMAVCIFLFGIHRLMG